VVNQHYFWKEVFWKHPEQWWNQDWFIHHDSVLNWFALSVHSGTLKIWLCSLILFAHLIRLLVISACFWEWDSSCESVISMMPQRYRSSFWSFYMQFQKAKFGSGRNAGHIAWTQKGTTLKGITIPVNACFITDSVQEILDILLYMKYRMNNAFIISYCSKLI
jgi:hypothetical protein